MHMASSNPYSKVIAETQQQAVKAVESGFDFAAHVLELQKQYTLGIAGLIVAATPSARD
jgi:hypothetical protein